MVLAIQNTAADHLEDPYTVAVKTTQLLGQVALLRIVRKVL